MIYQLLFNVVRNIQLWVENKSSSPFCDEHTVTGVDYGSGINLRNDVDNDVQLISKFDQHLIGELPKMTMTLYWLGVRNQKIGQRII